VTAPEKRPKLCAAPGCDEPLPEQTGRGGRRRFCSPRCRTASAVRTAPLVVEVDHETLEENTRPIGRVWLVKMRRGPKEVIVAEGLGRPSADYLAGQIADLIERPRRPKGGGMN
jgi:hypothetical protein